MLFNYYTIPRFFFVNEGNGFWVIFLPHNESPSHIHLGLDIHYVLQIDRHAYDY